MRKLRSQPEVAIDRSCRATRIGLSAPWPRSTDTHHGAPFGFTPKPESSPPISTSADGTPWWVSIDRGHGAGEPILVALHDLSIATSGCERCFRHGADVYSHTIDPRSGRPIDNGMRVATVLHRSCMMADAYATALMVMGPREALAFADRCALAAVIEFNDSENGVVRRCEGMSRAFQDML